MNAFQKNEERALKLTVGVYVLVFALKMTVYFMTGVMALFAEALHTLSDIFVSSFLLMAVIWSQKEADKVHMFGHGRAQNVAALVAATLFISFTSYKLYEEAVPRLIKPGEASYQNLSLALIVLVASMFIAVVPMVALFAQRTRGVAAKAQLMELFNDEMGLLAAFIGTLFITWGQYIADPFAAIVVATIIAVNAVGLFRENLSYLLGRAPGSDVLAMIEHLALSVEGVMGVHDLRAEYIGMETLHVGMHIEVRPRLPIEEADRIAEEVRERVLQSIRGGYYVIHVDPVSTKDASLG